MRNRALAALTTLGALVLWPASAGAHGGPPATHDVLLGSGHLSLVTSHGFFAEDDGWAWICEEVTGADLATSTVRTPSGWWVGTITGLRRSGDGCDWSDDPGLEGTYIRHVLQDVADPERVWVATPDGLWAVDGMGDATLEVPAEFSLRHVGQRQDGALLVVGFDGPLPVAELEGQRIDLPAETGRIEVLSADEQGRFYLRFPAGFTDRLVRVSEDGAEVLLDRTDLIRDVVAIGSNLYVLYRDGVSWSADDGASWSPRGGEPITCLRSAPDGFYACPPATGSAALLYAPTLDADPTSWQWETALDFDEVANNTCEIGSTAGNMCPYLWSVVGEELGVIPSDAEAVPPVDATPSEGCGGASPPGLPPWLTLMLGSLLVMVRSRVRALPSRGRIRRN